MGQKMKLIHVEGRHGTGIVIQSMGGSDRSRVKLPTNQLIKFTSQLSGSFSRRVLLYDDHLCTSSIS